MQFKYPELLWALLLLLIPLFIHLFRLRRFQKTPFTNVKFLKKVVSESRRSNTLKKWLLLFTRMLLLASMILAFAQPFFAKKSALREKETVIYLDDSFSMQAKTENGTLLSDAVQELLKAIPEESTFSLFTNKRVYKDVSVKDVQNELLSLEHTSKQLNLDDIQLKSRTFFNDNEEPLKNLIIISDFQQRMITTNPDSLGGVRENLIRMAKPDLQNISIDSVYTSSVGLENIEVTALLSSNGNLESTPVSLFNGERLIAKTSANFDQNRKAQVAFTLSSTETVMGKIEISDSGLAYDNQLYFNIDSKEKIKVLSVGSANSDYLKRIFSPDEFQFSEYSLKNLNYGNLDEQNLIVLNELESIPNALSTALGSFLQANGSLVVIPSENIDFESYNRLSSTVSTNFTQRVDVERNITSISFSHPIYKNVFEKNVTNFQYPRVTQYYRVKTNVPTILSFQDGDPFLFGTNNVFVFTASLKRENSNFKNSPLIVPTFYNMGVNSLKLPELYHLMGSETQIDIPLRLSKDNILKVSKEAYEFIPQQKSFANKVSLSFLENPVSDGIYTIRDGENLLRNISFNHVRTESELVYGDLSNLNAESKNESIASLFQQLQNDNTVNELWKWFVILALFFMGIEVLIQKYIQ